MDEAGSRDPKNRIPPLRAVEILPHEESGRRALILHDRAGLGRPPVLVPEEAAELLAHLDGTTSVRDLQAHLMRRRGELVSSETLLGFVESLDEAGLLDSPSFHRRARALAAGIRRSTRRAAAHAGSAYPADTETLRRMLAEHGDPPGGDPASGATIQPRAIALPHVDVTRGAVTYAHAVRGLEAGEDPDRYLLLGTTHAGLERPLSLLPQALDTPLGHLPLDTTLADRLLEFLGEPTDADLLAHRAEHSLEMAAAMIAVARGGRPVPAVPLLCDGEPERLDPLLKGLTDALRETGGLTVVVAAVDLSHVGPRFGDPVPVSDAFLDEILASDRRVLARATAGDPEGFAREVAVMDNRTRICGVGPLYVLLHIEQGASGQLAHHGHALAPDRSQAVTFAALVFPA